jgi:hypothetical protein
VNPTTLDLLADPNGPFHGPLAHAFACAVHISVHSGAAWNSPDRGCDCCNARAKRKVLVNSWGIKSADDWRTQQEALIDGHSSNETAGVLLDLRRQAMAQTGSPLPPQAWYQLIAELCRQNGLDNAAYQHLAGTAQLILAYEQRFVHDGLLPPGGLVHDIRAWDLGRGVNMARWGVQCRFADLTTGHAYAVRAGELSRQVYGSWAEFSAGYVLGRCLHFDNGEFGSWYTEPLAVHHTMVTHPHSPWLHLPFRS